MSDQKFRILEDTLGRRFSDRNLLRAALTHSSTGADRNYERLEFLGDRVLNLVMADILYKLFPGESEGDLAKRHAALVQGPTVASVAREIDLGAAMELSEAERFAGGAENDNILADGLEGVLGALYIDGGYMICHALITDLWGNRVHTMAEPPQDSKTALQEWAQARGLPLPVYEIVSREGPDHAPQFAVRVIVQGYEASTAPGSSRRAAEKEAARLLLSRLKEDGA